mgnify:CR=1 FL=1
MLNHVAYMSMLNREKVNAYRNSWQRIVEAVDDFVQNPKNKLKLKDVAEVAVQNFPNNTRDFFTTLKALGG